MNRPVRPIRREEARLPEAGATLLRRYALLSLVIHVTLAGLSLVSLPVLHHRQRTIFAPRIYEVALVPAPVPNYEPPFPQPEKKKQPAPVKPVKAPETKTKPKTEEPKEKPVKTHQSMPSNAKPTPTTTGTSEKPQTATTTSAPDEHPVSMGMVDQANFHQDYYLETIRSILVRLWDPPTGGTEGLHQASIHFVVQRDGTITDPQITAGSGWPLYDRSALGAVVAAIHKLPPLPEGYDGNELGLTVNFQRVEEGQP
jgi:outer membrane biosynthesis protein TonB